MRPSRLLSYLLPCAAAKAILAVSHEFGNLHVRADPQEDAIITSPTDKDIFFQGQPYAVQWTPPKSKVPVWVSLTATWSSSSDFNDLRTVTLSNIAGDTAVVNNGTFWWVPNNTTFQGRWYLVLYTVSEGTDCSKVSCAKFEYNENSTYVATGAPFMIANALPAVETPTNATSNPTSLQTTLPTETGTSVSTPIPSAISRTPATSPAGIAAGLLGGLVVLILIGAGVVSWRRGWFRPREKGSSVQEKCEMDAGFDGTRPVELPARRWHAHELEGGWSSLEERSPAELPKSGPRSMSRDEAVVNKA